MKKLISLLGILFLLSTLGACKKKNSPAEETIVLPEKEVVGTTEQVAEMNKVSQVMDSVSNLSSDAAPVTRSLIKSQIYDQIKKKLFSQSLSRKDLRSLSGSDSVTINASYYCAGYDNITDGEINDSFVTIDRASGSVTLQNYVINFTYSVPESGSGNYKISYTSSGRIIFNSCKNTIVDLDKVSTYNGVDPVPYKNIDLAGTIDITQEAVDIGYFAYNYNTTTKIETQNWDYSFTVTGKTSTPNGSSLNGKTINLDHELKAYLKGGLSINNNTAVSSINIDAKGYMKVTGLIDTSTVKFITPFSYQYSN